MRNPALWFIVPFMLVHAHCGTSNSGRPTASADALVREAQARFTYKGKPIPPFFLHDLAGGRGAHDYNLTGMGHRICALSVEGLFVGQGYLASSYDLLQTRKEGAFYVFDYYEDPLAKDGPASVHGYRFVGTTPKGTTVLEYYLGSRSSAFYPGVSLVRFAIEETFDFAGGTSPPASRSRQRLVMRYVGRMAWGDRVTRDVRLDGAKLILGPATTCLPDYENLIQPAQTILLE